MLEVQKIREEWELCRKGLQKRNINSPADLLSTVVQLDDERKGLQKESDELAAEINKMSTLIGGLMKSGDSQKAESVKLEVAEKKEKLKVWESRHKEVIQRLEDSLLSIPNIPSVMVPQGKGSEDNEVYKDWEGNLDSKEGFLPHWEIAERLGLFDLKLGVKIAGSGFPVYRGKGAKLQRALINFFLEENIAAGYEEFQPPHLVNEETAKATGQLPDKEGQMYHIPIDNLYLIPTAEVPVTNIYRDVILQEGDFPVKMTAYTPCFRREAGSYGADVKGLNRVHQFDKVEIVEIAHPQNSYERLQAMLSHVESLLKKLELPYRILRLCGGDMSFTSALTYDFEVYSIGQGRWLEVSSVSNFETYQSNRLKLRYKDKAGKSILAHTLNGSSLALPRILASLLEWHQSPEGIIIPEALRPYTGFDKI